MQEELVLLSRARAFDQDALAQIHDTYYGAVYRYISFRVGDPQAVEDLAGEVFVRFLRALGERNAPQNTIRGWLFGAASRVVKEYYRKEGRASLTQLDESIPGQAGDPAQSAEAAFVQESVRQAVTDLTEDQQQVLALRFGWGLSIREAAEALNKSEGSVKMLQVRAIATLSRKLSPAEVGQ